MSASWVAAEVTPSVRVISLRYWCRIGSVDCFHAGFRMKVMDLPGMYEVIWYGPSEILCSSSCKLFGRYESYSTGRAEVNGIESMYRKSLAGWIRWNCSSSGLTATRPGMVCEFWKPAMLAAVTGWALVFVK